MQGIRHRTRIRKTGRIKTLLPPHAVLPGTPVQNKRIQSKAPVPEFPGHIQDLLLCFIPLHQANLKIAIPFLVSSNGYGILLSTGSTALFQDTQYGSYLYTEADEEMDYYFIAGGSMDAVSYTHLVRKSGMPEPSEKMAFF